MINKQNKPRKLWYQQLRLLVGIILDIIILLYFLLNGFLNNPLSLIPAFVISVAITTIINFTLFTVIIESHNVLLEIIKIWFRVLKILIQILFLIFMEVLILAISGADSETYVDRISKKIDKLIKLLEINNSYDIILAFTVIILIGLLALIFFLQFKSVI